MRGARRPRGDGAGHLSGGLDSSSVSVLAARKLAQEGREYHGFCLHERIEAGLDLVDEFAFARLAAGAETNISLHSVQPTEHLELLQKLDENTAQSIHPAEPEEQVLRHVAQMGIGVVFSGWGGDECVTWRGGGDLAELLWSGRWRQFAHELSAQARRRQQSIARVFRGRGCDRKFAWPPFGALSAKCERPSEMSHGMRSSLR